MSGTEYLETWARDAERWRCVAVCERNGVCECKAVSGKIGIKVNLDVKEFGYTV